MAAFPSPRRDPRTRSESPFPTLPVGDATGPIRTFATLSCAAVQLHQTGHSPRAQNLEVCGLTLSRQGCDPVLQWVSMTIGCAGAEGKLALRGSRLCGRRSAN